jgi:hypothetical protein
MRPPRPAGFGFFTVCALLTACGCAFALAVNDGLPVFLPGRMAVAATGALALVTAEALARVRPWAFSASVAFAGTFIVMLLLAARDEIDVGIAMSGGVGLFALVALSIVHNGLGSVYGPRPVSRRYPAP